MRHDRVTLCVHFVWRTWDRQPLITPSMERALHRAIEAEAVREGCTVLAIEGTEDHVHVLVLMPSDLAVADLVRLMKGGSSRLADETLLPGQFRWQGHYGAFSVSRWDIDRACRYVQQQKRHHAEGTLASELEEPTEEGPATIAQPASHLR